VAVLAAARSQCALSNSGMRVVACVSITVLMRRFWRGMSVRVMKCESVHNRSAVSAGMRGRRSKMRALSIAADEICSSSRRDCMACACGMRDLATDAVLCSAAVGCAKSWSAGCPSELCGACVWRPLFRDTAHGFRFFVPFRLYCLSCWHLVTWDLFTPHFFHCSSLPRSLFLSNSHLTVWMCSLSSI
jgi:hypothetical protein